MKYKYKVGDVLIWSRPWFTPDMDYKIVIGELVNITSGGEVFKYKAKFYKPTKEMYDGWNIFKEEELFRIGEQKQISLF